MTIAIRPATARDADGIDRLLRQTFPRADEAMLVRRLAADGDLTLAMVAADDTTGIVGMVAASRMYVTADGAEQAAVAIAPLAVAPDWRRGGVADALVETALDRLRGAGITFAFVLGEPGYYGRFGFDVNSAGGFGSPYAGPFLMAMRLNPGPCIRAPGIARHAPAFATLAAAA